jgi:FAD-linked sulfhydryl oxidase
MASSGLSDNGFAPSFWGPGMWQVIHFTAATFPSTPTAKDRRGFRAFFESLRHVLPCPGCRAGYESLISSGRLKLTDAVFRDRLTLFRWTTELHDAVNAKLGKPTGVDWRRWYAYYDQARSG